jgi:hypothetical protein
VFSELLPSNDTHKQGKWANSMGGAFFAELELIQDVSKRVSQL